MDYQDRRDVLFEAQKILARSIGSYKKDPNDMSSDYDMDLEAISKSVDEVLNKDLESLELNRSICKNLDIAIVRTMDDYNKFISRVIDEGSVNIGKLGSFYSIPSRENPYPINTITNCYIEEANELYFSNNSTIKYRVKFDSESIVNAIKNEVHPIFVNMVTNMLLYDVYGEVKTDPANKLHVEFRGKMDYLKTTTYALEYSIKDKNISKKAYIYSGYFGTIKNIYKLLLRVYMLLKYENRPKDRAIFIEFARWATNNNVDIIRQSLL